MLIQDIQTKKQKKSRRIGRGGKRGTFSGRGTKGQKARSGRRIRPALRDIIKKIPKLRGRGKHSFKSFGERPAVVNVRDLEKNFNAGEKITPRALVDKGLVNRKRKQIPPVKLLGTGELTKKFTVAECLVSASAKAKIEKVGGSVAILAEK